MLIQKMEPNRKLDKEFVSFHFQVVSSNFGFCYNFLFFSRYMFYVIVYFVKLLY